MRSVPSEHCVCWPTSVIFPDAPRLSSPDLFSWFKFLLFTQDAVQLSPPPRSLPQHARLQGLFLCCNNALIVYGLSHLTYGCIKRLTVNVSRLLCSSLCCAFLPLDWMCDESRACTIQEAGISSHLPALIPLVWLRSSAFGMFRGPVLPTTRHPGSLNQANTSVAGMAYSQWNCMSVSSRACVSYYLVYDLVESSDFRLSQDLHSPIPQGLKAEFNFSGFLSLCLGATHSHSLYPRRQKWSSQFSAINRSGLTC